MGRLDAFTDMTGSMDALEVQAENIRQIIDELNRNSDQTDAIQNNLGIVATGKATLATTSGSGTVQVVNTHGLGFPPAVLAFYTRDSIGSANSNQMPNFVLDGSGNFLYSVVFTTTSNDIQFQISGTLPTDNFNFSYYLLKQPANLTSFSL